MLKPLVGIIWIAASLSCSKQKLQLTTSNLDAIKDPKAGDASSEITYSGALMIESIKSEMLGMRYSLDQISAVTNSAKTEVSLVSSLSIENPTELSLSSNGATLNLASIAVAKGAVKALKGGALPEDAGIIFQLANSTKPDQLSMATIIKGQTKGMGLVKARGKIGGLDSEVMGKASSEMALTALSSGAKSGMITSDNAPQMVSAIAKSLFGNLKKTSLELDADKIIPSFANSLPGLKSLNLPKESLILVTQTMVKESISGIQTNSLEAMTGDLLPEIISNTMVGTFAVSTSNENFSSAAAEVGKSALSSVNQIGMITSKSEGSSFASIIFSSSMKSMDKIPDWNVEQITSIAMEMREKAMESALDLGFSGNDAADILVEATISMVKTMGSLDRMEDLVVSNDTLTQSFNQITEATTKDLSSSISGVNKDYSTTMQTAVSTAATEGSAPPTTTTPSTTPSTTVPTVPSIAIPTLITKLSPTQNRGKISSLSFTVGSAAVGQTIKFYSDSNCTQLLGEGPYTTSATPISFSLTNPGTYQFYAKAFDSSQNSSACANTGETYTYDNSTPIPGANIGFVVPPTGNLSTVNISVTNLEVGATIEVFSDNSCSALLASAVVSMTTQTLGIPLPATGSYNFYLKQTDDLANSSACISPGLSYTYDVTNPSLVSLSLVTPTTSPSNQTSITVRASGTEAGSTVQIFGESSCTTATIASTAGMSGSTDLTLAGFVQGSNALYGKQIDAAGNSSGCSSVLYYVLDSNPPAPPTVTLAAGQLPNTNLSAVNLNFTLSETGGSLKIYSNSICTVLQTTVSVSAVSFTHNLSGQGEGPHAYYATHTDAQGNISACSPTFASWTMDSTPPASPILAASTSPAGPSAAMNISIMGTAEANSTVNLYDGAGCGTYRTSANALGSGSFSIPYTIPTANSSYTFAVRSVDLAGNESNCSASSVSYVNDTTIASILNVYSSNTVSTTAAVIDISVSFSQTVYVTGSPRLELELGGTGKYANYFSGSGSSVLIFRYTVAAGDNNSDLDYKSSNALTLNGGTIKNASTTDAVLALSNPGSTGSLGFNQNIKVDTTPPTISDIPTQSTMEDVPTGSIPFTINDSGNILDCLAVTVTTSNPSVLPLVNIVKSGTAPSCSLTLNPEMNANGSSTVTVSVNDGVHTAVSDSFLFNVTAVNDAPTFSTTIPDQAMPEDGMISGLALSINDVDNSLVCSSAITATSSDTNIILPAGITFAGTAPNCTLSATPLSNKYGSVDITVTVSDGTSPVSDTFTLNINPVNDSPQLSAIGNQMTNEDTPINFNFTLTDVDSALTQCDSAIDTITSDNSGLLPPFSPNLVITGTVPSCTISLSPAPNQSGLTTISLRAYDGISVSNTVMFDLNVTPINDPPTMSTIGDQYMVFGGTRVINFTVSDLESTVSCTAVSRSSNLQSIVLNSSLTVTGSGGNCQLNISSSSTIAGNTLINLGYTDGGGLNVTRSFVLYNKREWFQEAYIKAPNGTSGLFFGRSLSLNNDTLVVGAEMEGNAFSGITNTTSANAGAPNSGAAYVYNRIGPNWSLQAYIKASNNRTTNFFGNQVSLSGDTLAVGAYHEGSAQTTITPGLTSNTTVGAPSSGAAYIFSRMSTTWTQQAYIKASNNQEYDYFASSLQLDGNTLAVGSSEEDSNSSTTTISPAASTDNSLPESGAVFIFNRDGTTWSQAAYIKASNVRTLNYFGDSLAVSGDTVAVGSWAEDSNQITISNGAGAASPDTSGTDSGAVYVYRRNGSTWVQEAYIKASNSEQNDSFSSSIALSGGVLAVGAELEDSNQTTISSGALAGMDNGKSQSGAVYIFNRSGTVWSQQAYLKASNSGQDNNFGRKISLSGSLLAVGVPFDDNPNNTITYGIPASTAAGAGESGGTFIYKYANPNWYEKTYIKPSNNNAGNQFGFAVSTSGDSLAVSAPEEDSNQLAITNGSTSSMDTSSPDSGAAYIFRNTDQPFDPKLRVLNKTNTSVTLGWGANLGTTTTVKVAPAISGVATPLDCNAGGSITLGAGATTYTYSGLTANSRYGFRVCGFDGSTTSGGVIWETTNP